MKRAAQKTENGQFSTSHRVGAARPGASVVRYSMAWRNASVTRHDAARHGATKRKRGAVRPDAAHARNAAAAPACYVRAPPQNSSRQDRASTSESKHQASTNTLSELTAYRGPRRAQAHQASQLPITNPSTGHVGQANRPNAPSAPTARRTSNAAADVIALTGS